MNDGFGNGGDFYSPQDVIQRIADQFGIGAFMPMLMPFIKSLTGNDVAWDTIFASNRGPVGIFYQNQNRAAQMMSNNVAREFQRQQMRERLTEIQQTLYSQQDWIRRNGSLDGYNAHIQSQVDAKMAKGGLKFVWDNFLTPTDWDSTWSVSQNLSKVAYNLAQPGLRLGQVEGITFASEVAGKLFEGAYNKGDWGGFSKKGASEMAAILAENVDFFRGADISKTESFTNATKRFKSTMQEYLKALSPLKEIMGDDTSKMVKAMEEITGQQLTSMNPSRVAALAQTLASRTLNGRWTMTEYNDMLRDITMNMTQMRGLSPWAYNSTAEQAVSAMDIAKGYARPTFLTDAQWNAASRNLVMQTNNSAGAEYFAKTYALWKENVKPEGTFDDFMAAIASRPGVDARTAARQLARVNYDYELNSARGSKYYVEAMTSGNAGRLDRNAFVDQQRALAADLAGTDASFMRVAGIGIDSPGAYDRASSLFSSALYLVEGNARLMQMSADEQEAELRRMAEAGGTPGAAASAMLALGKGKFGNVIRYMESNSIYNKQLVYASARANELEAALAKEAYDDRAKLISRLDANIFNPKNFAELLKGGDITGNIKEMFKKAGILNDIRHPGLVEATVGMTARLAKDIYEGDDKDSQKSRQALASSLYHYSASAEGLANKGFMKALIDYSKLNPESEEAQNLMYKMLAYKEAGAEAVDRFFDDDVWENGQMLKGKDADAVRYARLKKYAKNSRAKGTADKPTSSLAERLKYAAMASELNKDEVGDDERKAYKNWLDWQKKNYGKDGELSFTEGWKTYYEDELKQANAEANRDVGTKRRKVLESINERMKGIERDAGTGGTNWQDKLINVLDMLEKFLKEWNSNNLKPQQTAETSGGTNNSNADFLAGKYGR